MCGFFELDAQGRAEGIEIQESTLLGSFSVLNHCRIRK